MMIPRETPYMSDKTEMLRQMFDALVGIGEEKSLVILPLHLHNFLVECLAEYVDKPEIVHCVLALGLLNSGEKTGEQRSFLLKRTGDGALLLAGLYPERAGRLRVSASYFRVMGQTAYTSLAANLQAMGKTEPGELYNSVARDFKFLVSVLKAARARPELAWDKAFKRFRESLQ